MAANSQLRRALKTVLRPFLDDRAYRLVQAASKAWDIRTGGWTEPEIDLVPYAVRPGETALDLGANFGLYAYHLSRALGPQGQVHAFEPVPFTYGTLLTVLKLLRTKNIATYDKGVGERDERVRFTVPVATSGALSTGQAHAAQRDDERPGREKHVKFDDSRTFECHLVALDDFLPSLRDLSLIKCDIEEAELFAFRGAVEAIERFRPTVICEIVPWFIEGFGETLDSLVGFFTSRGYETYIYKPDKTLAKVTVAEIVEDNYVFIHPRYKQRFETLM